MFSYNSSLLSSSMAVSVFFVVTTFIVKKYTSGGSLSTGQILDSPSPGSRSYLRPQPRQCKTGQQGCYSDYLNWHFGTCIKERDILNKKSLHCLRVSQLINSPQEKTEDAPGGSYLPLCPSSLIRSIVHNYVCTKIQFTRSTREKYWSNVVKGSARRTCLH